MNKLLYTYIWRIKINLDHEENIYFLFFYIWRGYKSLKWLRMWSEKKLSVSLREAKRKARFPQNVDGCLACRELLCNNIVVSCTTNVERRLELSEPWIDGITGWQSTPVRDSSRSRVSLHCERNTFRTSYRDIVQFLPRERERNDRGKTKIRFLNTWVAESHAAGKLEIRSNRANRRYNTAR